MSGTLPAYLPWFELDENLLIVLSFSINGSFEWEDDNQNGQWDIDAASASESVVDMGLRGLRVFVE